MRTHVDMNYSKRRAIHESPLQFNNVKSMTPNARYQQGLTWIEVLIVITTVGLLAVIFLNFFNPLEKRDQATNSQQKSDLDRLAIALEDYYNDKGCYPGELSCTPADKADDLKPYLGTIPCDPATGQSYFYDPEDSSCPKYYRIYTTFKWEKDPAIAAVGCLWGCGPADAVVPDPGAGFPFNYGVSSPNVRLESAESICGSGGGTWHACQASRCNRAGNECCLKTDETCDSSTCPKCWPISECYCNDPTCGGKCD